MTQITIYQTYSICENHLERLITSPTHTSIHAHAHTYTHIHTPTHKYTLIHTHTYTPTRTHPYTHIQWHLAITIDYIHSRKLIKLI